MPDPQKTEFKNISPQGNTAGRDVIQVGRDYLRFIQVNINSENWGLILLNLLLLFIAISGAGFGARSVINYYQKTIVNSSPTSDPTVTPTITPEPNPFDNASFPQAACGDVLPLDKSRYPVRLYPVFIVASDSNFNRVKTEFCQDAIEKQEGSAEVKVIQVASFLDIGRAHHFKNLMISKFSSGAVGIGREISEIPPSLLAKATEEKKSESGFQKVMINCDTSPISKLTMDLEVTSCLNFDAIIKNYSRAWYEIEFSGGTAWLIGPGDTGVVPYEKPHKAYFWVKKHSGSPSREMEVSCDENPKRMWGLNISPKCNSDGTYIDIESAVRYPTTLSLDNDNNYTYQPSLAGGNGYVTSGGKTVSFKLSVIDDERD